MKITKHNILRSVIVLSLVLALTLGCLATSALALCPYRIYGGIMGPITKFTYFNEQGEEIEVKVYDDDGNPLWIRQRFGQNAWDWIPTPAGWTPAVREQEAAALQSELEQRYGIRIDGSRFEDAVVRMQYMDDVGFALSQIPAALRESVRQMMATQGRTLQVKLMDFPDGQMMWAGRYSQQGDVITMYQYSAYNFAHEYGHLLYTFVAPKVGYGNIDAKMRELSHGAAYQRQDASGSQEGSEHFLSMYGRTSVSEEFAEAVAMLTVAPAMIWNRVNTDGTETGAAQKAAYIRDLLMQTFSLDDSVLFPVDPPQPSAWAAEGVARFQSEGFAFSFDPDGVNLRYGYAAERQIFAQWAYLLADRVWQEQHPGVAGNLWSATFPEAKGIRLIAFDPFADTTDESIIMLHRLGIINGKGEKLFDPYGSITREEAAAILCRLCGVLGYDFSGVTPAEIADSDAVSDWALESVRLICGAGIMNGVGDGVFDPKGTYTTEQSMLTLIRCYTMLLGSG